MMKLVMSFYKKASDALSKGADMKVLVDLPSREAIGRFKYTPEEKVQGEYERIINQLDKEIADALGKED